MSRYIDAAKFELFTYTDTEGRPDTFDAGVQFVLEKIDATPTVDVAPVVHAEWIQDGCMYKCSNCGNRESYYDDCYCRVCGAKMDG